MRHEDPKVSAAKSSAKRVLWISFLIVVPLTIYFVFFALDKDSNVEQHGYIAHALAVVVAFISASLFMGITFYSSRSGHDEQPNYRDIVEKQRERDAEAETSGSSDTKTD
jgi:hypothetical protein